MSDKFGSSLKAGFFAGVLGALLVVLLLVPEARETFKLSSGSTEIPESTTSRLPGEAGDQQQVAHEARVIEAVAAATPAVVSIIITKDVPVIERYFEEVPSPFEDFFGQGSSSQFRFRVPRLRQRGTEQREIGGGSGFLISSDGMIITNRHVVQQTDVDYTVFLSDGTKHPARVVARDPLNDLAIIKIEASGLTALPFGDSDTLQVGQSVVAIGNALSEFQNSVSVGVISGLSRSITAGTRAGRTEQLEEVIQTDAAINPGNSGGPLLNLAGEVIGVNVAVALGSENIGFALPVNLVRSIVDSVNKTGRIVRPLLGVRYVQITPVVQERNLLPVDYGVLVTRGEEESDLAIIPGSAADKAGIQEGDIILEIDGVRLIEETSLASIIRKKKVGDTITLTLLRADQERVVSVSLEEAPQ